MTWVRAGFLALVLVACAEGAASVQAPAPGPMPAAAHAPAAAPDPPPPAEPPPWFARADAAYRSLAAALPSSRARHVRPSTARVLVEIRPHGSRADSAHVVIDGHAIDDFRTLPGRRLLSRWFAATYLVRTGGWEPPRAGVVIMAAAELDAEVLAEILVFAFGHSLDGPVELAMRRAGTDAVTTIAVALAKDGLAPTPGPWGVWARAIDDAASDTPVGLELGDIVGDVYAFRDKLEPATTVTRIAEVTSTGGLRRDAVRSVAERHRHEATHCHRHAAMFTPGLEGSWRSSFTVDRRGNVSGLTVEHDGDDARAEACVLQMIPRWKFPRPRADAAVTITFAFESRG